MARPLITVQIKYHPLGYYDIIPNEDSKNRGMLSIHIKCTDDDFKKLLFKYHAKDSSSQPKSQRGITYNQMIIDIKNNNQGEIFHFWQQDYNNFYNSIQKVTIINENIKDISIKIAKDIFGEKYILEKDFIKDTYKSILKENDKMADKVTKKSLYVKFLESKKNIEEFLEDVTSGEITPELDNTSGKQNPDISTQTDDMNMVEDDGAHLIGNTVTKDVSTSMSGGNSIDPVLAEQNITEDNAGNGIEVSVQDTESDEIIDKNITGFVEDYTPSPDLATQPNNNKIPEPENKSADANAIDSGAEEPGEVKGTGTMGGGSADDPEKAKLKENDLDNVGVGDGSSDIALNPNDEVIDFAPFETNGDAEYSDMNDLWQDVENTPLS